MSTNNISQLLLLKIQKANWDVRDILTTSFALELEHVIRHSNRFEWNASQFLGNSSREEISDFGNLIQTIIRQDEKDALILVKKFSDFFWVSVTMKNLKKIGIYEKPRYVVVTSNGRYFFSKDKRSDSIVEYLMTALGYERYKKIKLSGKSLPSLVKLLLRREQADMKNRPVYERGEAVVNEQGIDFTQKKSYHDFFDRCMDHETDIDLQKYTVSSVNCPWLGDDNPNLRKMEFKTAITFSGDVTHILKQLPVASVVKPPFPNYIRNYLVNGRNLISLKSHVKVKAVQRNRIWAYE